MKKAIALALMLALGGGLVHADDKRADEKKSAKAKANAKKKEERAADKSDKNVFQKSESSIGKWARENKVWGTPRAGDKK